MNSSNISPSLPKKEEEEMDRLQAEFDRQTVQEKPTDSKSVYNSATYLPSDSDDDEKVLSIDHSVGGRLEHAIGYDEVHVVFDFPQYDLKLGEEAPENEVFMTTKALERYPSDYVCAANRDTVARGFFSNGKIYQRDWDLFYIHSLYPQLSGSRKSVILVPSRQVQHLLVTINNILQTHLKIPDNAIETGLLFTFPKDGTPRPRYLGRTDDREMAECLKNAIPSASWRPEGEVEQKCHPTKPSLEAFKRKIELLLESEKKKKAANKERKKSERFAKQKSWCHEAKRVQRYLGLREACHYDRVSKGAVKALKGLSLGMAPLAIDVEKPVPYPQENSVVFVCVDVESFERDHNLITEIGIATLDTLDISTTNPGERGINWARAIRARHFRIKEYQHLVNKDFVVGCPENFQFGKSEWIGIQAAPREISKCFKPPYSSQLVRPIVEERDTTQGGALDGKRNIILVGHDVMSDINYLQKLGYDPTNLSNLQELIDTSSMYRALEREQNARNLGSVLANLDLNGWYLHNAGNDAVYTLQAMIAIALKAILEPRDSESREKEIEMRIAESAQQAAESVREAQQGWSSEGSDGGPPTVLGRRTQPIGKGKGKMQRTTTQPEY